MRFHPRRVLSYALLGVCLLIVILNIQQNTSQVTEKELAAVLKAHGFESNREEGDQYKEYESDQFDPNLPGILYVHTPVGAPKTFRRLVASRDPWEDRILPQMTYVPSSYNQLDYITAKPGAIANAESGQTFKQGLKVIFLPAGLGDTPIGRSVFMKESCPVDACFLTQALKYEQSSHAHVIQSEGYAGSLLNKKPRGQIWILWSLESPLNTGQYTELNGQINWTASYRADSTIVTPYERFVPHTTNKKPANLNYSRNYASGKTRQVAWFVSNCGARNRRKEYAAELAEHISVDIYGACGDYQCPRSDSDHCNQLLSSRYKFYLSFENSNCKYYITEKFFWNGLRNDVVPVVMGGRKEDYQRFAPPHSFIHVEDFKSASHLADYLKKLDQNDQLYNQYFNWKTTGEFINTKFWCRVCAMLHDDTMTSVWYDDVERWWRSNGTCTEDRWDRPEQDIWDWEKAALS